MWMLSTCYQAREYAFSISIIAHKKHKPERYGKECTIEVTYALNEREELRLRKEMSADNWQIVFFFCLFFFFIVLVINVKTNLAFKWRFVPNKHHDDALA